MIGSDDLRKDLEEFRDVYGKDPRYVWIHPEMPFELRDQLEKNGMGKKIRHHSDASKTAFILSILEEFSPDGE